MKSLFDFIMSNANSPYPLFLNGAKADISMIKSYVDPERIRYENATFITMVMHLYGSTNVDSRYYLEFKDGSYSKWESNIDNSSFLWGFHHDTVYSSNKNYRVGDTFSLGISLYKIPVQIYRICAL